MKINTNKITFKYLKWLHDWGDPYIGQTKRPVSLCVYFWSFIWGLICLPFAIIPFLLKKYQMISLVSPIIVFFFIFFGFIGNDIFKFTFTEFLAIPLAAVLFICILSSIIGIIVLIVWIFKKLFSSDDNGIFYEFFKAKKQRICPLIEYIDEEDSKAG